MFFPSKRSKAAFAEQRIAPLTALSLLAVTLVGCASPGIPRPPSLNLSRLATNLSAQRVGDAVVLAWTTPDRTTDNLALKGPLTARVCRKPVAATTSSTAQATGTQQSAACLQVARLPVLSGESTATDPLPAAFSTGPATLLEYSVEILNPSGRSAGLAAPVFAAAGAAPAPVEALHATPIPTGIMLEWKPVSTSSSSSFVDLTRIDTTLQAEQKQAKSTSKQSIQLGGKRSAEVHLHAQAQALTNATGNSQPDGNSPPATEPAGTLDNTARFGDTYTYTARRLRTVQLGGHSLTLESTVSAPITITLRDIFPPAVPTGLAAIPNRQPASIDLSWQPNTEPDLAGYMVYRHVVSSSGVAARLTPNPISATDFRDTTAAAGQRYSYSVTAIDASGNESKPSQPAEESLPAAN